MPVNVLLIRPLLNFYPYYGDSFKIECPTRSGRMMNLFEVAEEIVRRLTSIFVRDEVTKDQLIRLFGRIDAASVLEIGKCAAFESVKWTAEKPRPV